MKVLACASDLKICLSFLLQAKEIPGARNNASVRESNSILKFPTIFSKQHKDREIILEWTNNF